LDKFSFACELNSLIKAELNRFLLLLLAVTGFEFRALRLLGGVLPLELRPTLFLLLLFFQV
jgi:hypothetical protein